MGMPFRWEWTGQSLFCTFPNVSYNIVLLQLKHSRVTTSARIAEYTFTNKQDRYTCVTEEE